MAFKIVGVMDGFEYEVRWDGQSYAQKGLMGLYRSFLRAMDGQFLGFMPGDGAEHDHDKNPAAAYAAWMQIFDDVTERDGDFPWEAHEEGEVL